MSKQHPIFEQAQCVSCGICVQSCPFSCLTMSKLGKQGKYANVFPELTNERCVGCGLCQKACPMDAVSMTETAEGTA